MTRLTEGSQEEAAVGAVELRLDVEHRSSKTKNDSRSQRHQALTPESEETLAAFTVFFTVLAAWTMTVERRETEVEACFFMRADIFDKDLTNLNDRSYHPIRTILYIMWGCKWITPLVPKSNLVLLHS